MSTVSLVDEPFSPWEQLNQFHARVMAKHTRVGASSVFVGTMRDFNDGIGVKTMYLEYYPEMTEKELWRIVSRAYEKWSLDDVLIIHRVGLVKPQEPIVLVAAWSEHRAACLEACQYMIESLKHQAPFWKKETLENNQQRWVSNNIPFTPIDERAD